MAKMKQLELAIQAGDQRCKSMGYQINYNLYRHNWHEAERIIEEMTYTDFSVTYPIGDRDSPLSRAIVDYRKGHLAESIIKKNPLFASKLVIYPGTSLLHQVCQLPQDDACRIADLLLPHMSQEELLSGLKSHNSTFLHVAAMELALGGDLNKKQKNYKIVGSVPPEIIDLILKEDLRYNEEQKVDKKSHYNLVQFLYEAIHVYDMEIALHSQEADNYFRKGVILQGMGKNEKAIKCYQKAIDLDHSYADKIHGVTLAPSIEQLPVTAIKDNPELLKAKIMDLTQQLSELSKKTMMLSQELVQLKGSLKITEEHKGQQAEPPSYEDEVHIVVPALPSSLPPDVALCGDISITDADIVLHS